MSMRADLDRPALRQSLILIVVGGVLVAVDFTVGSLDLLNDTVGAALILLAVFQLLRQPGPRTYGTRMQLLLFITAAMTLWSLVIQLNPELGLGPLGVLVAASNTVGLILFCTSMRDLARAHGLLASADSWRQASILVLIFFGIGWLLSLVFYAARAIDQGTLTPTRVSIDLSGGIEVILVLLILVGHRDTAAVHPLRHRHAAP